MISHFVVISAVTLDLSVVSLDGAQTITVHIEISPTPGEPDHTFRVTMVNVHRKSTLVGVGELVDLPPALDHAVLFETTGVFSASRDFRERSRTGNPGR